MFTMVSITHFHNPFVVCFKTFLRTHPTQDPQVLRTPRTPVTLPPLLLLSARASSAPPPSQKILRRIESWKILRRFESKAILRKYGDSQIHERQIPEAAHAGSADKKNLNFQFENESTRALVEGSE